MSAATKTQTTPPHQAPARRGRWGWIVLLLVAGAVAGGWYYHTKGAKAAARTAAAEHDSGADQASDEPVPVETVHVSKGGIQRSSAQIGSVQPFKEADLYAKVSGYLQELHVDYGDRVKQGQVLAEIDDPEVVKQAEKAAADVELARAAVEQALAFVESAKADRDAAASSVEQAVAEVDRYKSMSRYHQKKYARYQELVQSKAIPQQIADEEEESY
jgi:HlyD family secretion protein